MDGIVFFDFRLGGSSVLITQDTGLYIILLGL